MNLNGILAIGGKPGLYKMVSQTKNGMIVEGLDDKKRLPVYSTTQISSLEEISIYTYEEDVPLKDVLKNMFEKLNGDEPPNSKSSKNELMSFFKTILPNYNEDEVYPSDVKKVIQWYNTLNKNELLVFEDEVVEKTTDKKDEK